MKVLIDMESKVPFMLNKSILVVNAGSSSLKLGLYNERDGDEHVLGSRTLDTVEPSEVKSQVAHWLAADSDCGPAAIGHRVVHGGSNLTEHQEITSQVLSELERSVHFAPLHIPKAIELIKKTQQLYPAAAQFACFDTDFHRTLPEIAARMPIPDELFNEGIRKYGFHGLSYESIVAQLGRELPARVVIAHLGSGASVVALLNGRSIDTSMGLTPTGGIPMATRSGDLDPGVLLYLMRVKGMNVDSLEEMLNSQSGLTGLSHGRHDMRVLEKAEDQNDAQARLAINSFCLSIRKTIASYAAVLGGLDMLVFTGGIGENSERVRRRVCDGLRFLGISLNILKENPESVAVRIIPSQEDLQIARHCRTLMKMKRKVK
jgi:acetate kinase